MIAASPSTFRFTGRIADLSNDDRRALFDRTTSSDAGVRSATAAIVAAVRERGDAELRSLAERFDGARLDSLEVSRAARRSALDSMERPLRAALDRAAANIATVHAVNVPRATCCEPEPGVMILRRPDPLNRIGVYAPGGRAAYPSSVLMGAIPARVAGVNDVVLCTPPDRTGAPSTLVLAAAEIAEVDRVFAIGGAGAIAAMAFGTDTVPRVDRIVGPGNAYVAEAKLQVSGYVGIDSPAGPSELCVVADASSEPASVALEVFAQAEHDPMARVVVVAIGGDDVADRIAAEIAAMLDRRPRRDVISQALASGGGVLAARDAAEAIAFANEYAAEHLLLAVERPEELLPALRCAGTIFVGETSSVAFGDYMTGANHVLPTGGLARSYSGLSTSDFVRWTTIQTVTPNAARALAGDVARFAGAEGLPGHAAAARRFDETLGERS